jgi:hypothetical protein
MNGNIDLSPEDVYTDSDTELSIYRGVQFLKAVRAVVRFYSNVGNFIRLKNGHMIAVHINEEGVYFINVPQNEEE